MNEVTTRIEGRIKDLGGFTVARLLPGPSRRTVGPVVFFDHMGPASFGPGQAIDVRPHPHIHLATLTWLFEGAIVHRDSTGAHQVIRPGEVNWMIAGHGIVHSERAPEEVQRDGGRIHGVQLWVGLPRASEDVDPAFAHHGAGDLPAVAGAGWSGTVIAGEAFGAVSPVRTFSPFVLVELRLDPGATLALAPAYPERAVFVAAGLGDLLGEAVGPGQMVALAAGADATLTAGPEGALVILVMGAPLDGPRFLDWNFVSSRPEKIREARERWKRREFPVVPGDAEEFIPLPE
jgi:redox-sensitive bicupin YhaK (pirin superfamily)